MKHLRVTTIAVMLLGLPFFAGCVEDEQSQENTALLTGLCSDLLNNGELFVVTTNPVQN